jgi:hypothetical protein
VTIDRKEVMLEESEIKKVVIEHITRDRSVRAKERLLH